MKTSPLVDYYPAESRLERAESALADTREGLARNTAQIEALGEQMREGFSRLGASLDRLSTRLDTQLGVLTQQEPRINRLEEIQDEAKAKRGVWFKSLVGAGLTAALAAGSWLASVGWHSVVALLGH